MKIMDLDLMDWAGYCTLPMLNIIHFARQVQNYEPLMQLHRMDVIPLLRCSAVVDVAIDPGLAIWYL